MDCQHAPASHIARSALARSRLVPSPEHPTRFHSRWLAWQHAPSARRASAQTNVGQRHGIELRRDCGTRLEAHCCRLQEGPERRARPANGRAVTTPPGDATLTSSQMVPVARSSTRLSNVQASPPSVVKARGASATAAVDASKLHSAPQSTRLRIGLMTATIESPYRTYPSPVTCHK